MSFIKLTVKSYQPYRTDKTVGEIMPEDYSVELDEPEEYRGFGVIDKLFKNISPDLDGTLQAPCDVVISLDDVEVEATLEGCDYDEDAMKALWDKAQYEKYGVEPGDIVEYEGQNWVLERIGYRPKFELSGVKDEVWGAYITAPFSDVKLVAKKPETEAEVDKLLGKAEDLIGVQVTFNICNGYCEDDDFEEYTEGPQDVWSAGLDWNMYAKNYRYGKTAESISSTAFDTPDGGSFDVYPDDLFSEYTWDEIVDLFREERDAG